ncbi:MULTISPECIES: ABC transporter permease [unclassified Pseudoclavibacter]|uniref:ABC transporter permease n=1 Tax=unclassified Pseudoclavibacter TaxID=2615177 RepID=UPI001301511F|nr:MULTISPECIES: ABC transporter permease [unclassified Pseudoclavibacter]KAB1647036.1 ABC transporter permease [Pseudoclavibacter sp. CFCC 14310]KAB1657377.1 ABC transporter permease [Pseudoclavibacter sp. CFCC 11306]KAB1662995.1 ABC transporter permease [Pseudoclavibacter sp. CFCC 13611]
MSVNTVALSLAAVRRQSSRLNGSLIVGAILVALMVLLALVSLVWTPMDPLATDPTHRLEGPSAVHLLGTDGLGRDIASQIMAGARPPLMVGAVTVCISLVLGVPFGITSAMSGKRIGGVMMRWNDIVQAFPPLLLAIILAAVFGGSTTVAMIALGIGAAPGVARLVRSGTLQVLSREYSMAARAAGRGPIFSAFRHVLPNIRGMLIVQASVGFAVAILAEAALSYLGAGTPAPTPSWGRMLQEAQSFLYVQPLTLVWPGLAIAVTVLGFNLLGDGLRDRFDPRMEATR